MQALTLEVILRAVFGVEDDARRDELSENLVAILATTQSPRAVGLAIPRLRGLPPWRRTVARIKRTDELLAEEIRRRRTDPDLAEREDILSMLVAARFEDGSAMDDRDVRDQLMTLLVAGHETTATSLGVGLRPALPQPGGHGAAARGGVRRRGRLARRRDQRDHARAPGRPLHRAPASRAGRPRRVRPARGCDRDGRDLPHPHARRRVPRRALVPARALPRGLARDLLLDPLRRRHAAMPRRRLRPVRDEGRAAGDSAPRRAAPRRPVPGADRAPQRHPRAGTGTGAILDRRL